jgi:hypothetical protein
MLDIRSLSTGESAGSGLYEELMRAGNSHILQEFKAGRIVGEAYASVYLGAMQANLSAAIQYLLQYETVNKNLEVLDEQIKQNQKQNELLELQKEQLSIANATAKYNLDVMLPAQLLQLKKQTELVVEQVNQATAQTAQITAQIALTKKQQDLVDEQIRDAKDKHTNPTGGLNKAQYDKLMAEKAIADQKLITEKAQTSSSINGTAVGGLIGQEMTLKKNQGDSFLRNAEIQVAKLYSDAFSVMYSTDAEGMDNQAFGFGSDESFEVMKKTAAGIGITNFDHDHPASDLPSNGGAS